MPKFRYSLDTGTTWTVVDAALPYSIPSTAGQSVLVEPIGSAVTNAAVASLPAAPTVTLTAGDSQVSIAWSDNSNGGAAITAHRVYVNGTGMAPITSASPYVLTGLANGTAVSIQVSAINSVGEGPKSAAQSATPVAAGGSQPLRTVSANMIGQASGNGNSDPGAWHAFRQGYLIGSGDVSKLVISMLAWYSNSGVEANVTDMTFPELWAVYNGVSVRVTQGGSTTIVIPAGANDVQLDELLPSQFGATKFTLETYVDLRGVVYTVDSGSGTRVPVSQTIAVGNDSTHNEAMWFDNALGLPTNINAVSGSFTMPVYSTTSVTSSGTVATVSVGTSNPLPTVGGLVTIAGATPSGYNGNKTVTAVDTVARTFSYTVTSGLATPATGTVTYTATKYAQAAGYRPILLGTFVTGDPETWFHGGDSIDTALSDTTSGGGPWGSGRNARAMRDASGPTGLKAYLSCAVGGSSVTHFTGSNTKTWPYMKYARYALGAHLTNSFGIPGTGKTGAQMLSEMQAWWAKLKEQGIQKILALGAQTRGTTTDSWATEANQTIGAGWQAGGNVEQYYALLPAEIAAGRIDAFLNFQSWRGVDPNKWVVNGSANYATGDSTHPSAAIHALEAAEIRTAKATLV